MISSILVDDVDEVNDGLNRRSTIGLDEKTPKKEDFLL